VQAGAAPFALPTGACVAFVPRPRVSSGVIFVVIPAQAGIQRRATKDSGSPLSRGRRLYGCCRVRSTSRYFHGCSQ
jgi:hypothetical protein